MFTIDELLSKKNQRLAFEHLALKKDGCGLDGMHLSELNQYWTVNQQRICEEIREQKYKPGLILIREYMNKRGKRRNIASLNVIDRFITRLLSQKLNGYFSHLFLANSFAFQERKGVLAAVTKAKEYIEAGKRYVIEIDLKNYFDTIHLGKLMTLIEMYILDKAVVYLIKQYLFCDISFEERILKKEIGIVQGNSISPVLSNLYLHGFDKMLESRGFCWLRYADNIYVYTNSYEEALPIYNNVIKYLTEEAGLSINREKSGVFDVSTRIILGYDILIRNNKIDVRKHVYKNTNQYSNWHDSRLEFEWPFSYSF